MYRAILTFEQRIIVDYKEGFSLDDATRWMCKGVFSKKVSVHHEVPPKCTVFEHLGPVATQQNKERS